MDTEIVEQLTKDRTLGKRGMTPITVTLVANVPTPFVLAGSWFHTLDAAMSDLFVRFDNGKAVPAREAVGMEVYYSKFELVSATGGAVVVLVGFGTVTDGRATVNANLTTNVSPGNTFSNGGDVLVPDSAATQLLALDADRLYASIMVPSDAPGPVRVGTAAVGAANGQLIEPGMSVPIATTAALYAYHENGADTTVVCSAVRQV